MHLILIRHPDFPCAAVTRIDVEVTRAGSGALALRYVVTGTIADLRLPAMTAPARTDELWKHTCFEAFVRPGSGTAYCEFNLAPSFAWAAYRFDDTRIGMHAATEIDNLSIEVDGNAERFELAAALALDGMADFADASWRLGLSAVIEDTSGNRSYWALAHPSGRPDFHHRDCFTLELPAAFGP